MLLSLLLSCVLRSGFNSLAIKTIRPVLVGWGKGVKLGVGGPQGFGHQGFRVCGAGEKRTMGSPAQDIYIYTIYIYVSDFLHHGL